MRVISCHVIHSLMSCDYRVSDASGKLTVNDVGGYPLKREMLDTNVS